MPSASGSQATLGTVVLVETRHQIFADCLKLRLPYLACLQAGDLGRIAALAVIDNGTLETAILLAAQTLSELSPLRKVNRLAV